MVPADRPPGGDPSSGDDSGHETRTFEEFAREQHRLVPRHARALGIPEDWVEDLLQISLEKLWHVHAMIDSSRWSLWLWRAMLLRTLDQLKRHRRARAHAGDVRLLLQEWPNSASPEDAAHQRECARELAALLDRLPPERRVVACAYLIDDLPLKEIAARLGISENTAKDRWRLACIDMGADWQRERVKEHSTLHLATFFSTALALLVAWWRRLAGTRAGHATPLLACAACALLLTAPDPPPPASPTSIAVPAPHPPVLAALSTPALAAPPPEDTTSTAPRPTPPTPPAVRTPPVAAHQRSSRPSRPAPLAADPALDPSRSAARERRRTTAGLLARGQKAQAHANFFKYVHPLSEADLDAGLLEAVTTR